MHILSVRGALPEHRHTQSEITTAFVETIMHGQVDREVVERFHRNAGVQTRHTAVPLEAYGDLEDFGAANDAFIDAGVELGSRAVVDALKAVDLVPSNVDLIISATVTGLAVPSLDARVAAAIGMREDVVRMPLVGLGCVAGAAGVARLHDYLLGHPDAVAVLMSVELCSLTLQRDDASIANLVASGLFGDGAAAVVAAGRDRAASLPPAAWPQPEVLATRSRLYPDSERVMGWDVGSGGLKIVLDNSVPDVVRRYLGDDVDRFLADQGLRRDDLEWFVAHPGGPKVLEALADALGVEREALGVAWDSLSRIGNLSSASVLHVLADTLADRPPRAGSLGLMLAMGPGFSSELVLLRHPRETPVSSESWFLVLILLVGVERLAEVVVSTRNAAWAFERGGVERGLRHFPVMVVLHVGLLVGCLTEVYLADRSFVPALGWSMLAVAVVCQVLRWWCIAVLGRQWNTRVIVVPGMPLVHAGPYRFLPHPNYLVVVVEGVALPLVHGAWITALVFTVANAALLAVRIRVEEQTLREVAA